MTRTLHLCLAFFVAALSSPAAYGFCVEHPVGGTGLLPKAYWPNMPVTYKIHDTGSATGPLGASVQPDKAAEVAAVKAAFAQWAAATCVGLQFTDGGTVAASEVVNLQHTAPEIRVYWARDTTEWGLASTSSIARTFYNQDGTGKITSAGILLNAIDKSYSTTGDAQKYDVQSVVATEVGRVLGLAGVDDASAVMYPRFSAGSISKRTLAADDIAGIVYLYPLDGTCTIGTADTNCYVVQTDGGTAQEDGGATQQDGGGGQGDGGGGQNDAGGQACNTGSDCPSGICDVNHTCVPPADDGGCNCTVTAAGRGGYLTLALLLLGVALALGLRRRR